MKYSEYPSYRDSGIEWLGEIPEHWRNSYLKYIAKINMGQSPSSSTYNTEGMGIEFLQGNADFGKLYPTARTFTTEAKKMSLVEDILFTVRAPVGAMNLSDKVYAIGRGLCAISSTINSEKSFLWWLMPVVKMELDTVATGSTYEAVSVEQVSNSVVSLPPLQEQQTIANYLDKATAKIDTLIEKQTKLIELLREKRQAVISTAVTRGLDNTVAMKDSGVEWLGEIPEHWEVKQGKFIGKILSTPSVSDDSLDEISPILYIKVDDLNYINSKYLNSAKHRVSRNSGYVKAMSGFISFPKRGAAIFTNKACIVTVMSMIDPNLMAWLIFDKYNKEYILSLLLIRGLSEIADVSTVPQINNKHIEPLKFPIPPVREQEEIVNFIDDKTLRINILITKATKAIDLLKEKRTALISATVTGKIDVREF